MIVFAICCHTNRDPYPALMCRMAIGNERLIKTAIVTIDWSCGKRDKDVSITVLLCCYIHS
jgi:hypothetical protein